MQLEKEKINILQIKLFDIFFRNYFQQNNNKKETLSTNRTPIFYQYIASEMCMNLVNYDIFFVLPNSCSVRKNIV